MSDEKKFEKRNERKETSDEKKFEKRNERKEMSDNWLTNTFT